MYISSGHASAVMDNPANILWIFGAETHNSVSGMDNSMFRFDLADGLFKRQYAKNTWPGEYRVGADGILYADSAKTRPWAMHTFRRMRFIPATEEIEVLYNPDDHAYWSTTVQEGAITQVNNISAFWYYNVRTGAWRNDPSAARSQMARAAFAHGTCYVAGFGWYAIEGSFMYRMTEAGVFSATNVSGLVNGQYHSALYHKDGELIKIGGNLANSGFIYSRTPISNPAASSRFAFSSFAALTGHTIENGGSVQMPDGRFIIFPTRTSDSTIRPMILDVDANTITATGHSIADSSPAAYSFRLAWSDTYNCVIWVTGKVGGVISAYAYRPA
jgi:hypothetical protein